MYKIEFNDEMTIEGILLSFNNLDEAGIVSYIDIDGVIIYGNDVNLEERVKQEYIKFREKKELSMKTLKLDDSNNNEFKEQNNAFSEIFERRNDLYILSQDSTFLFEIGIVLEYTKAEYKEDMLNYYISVYSHSSKNKKGINAEKNLEYMSNLLLIIEDDSTLIQKKLRIQQIINDIFDNEDERYKFEFAIKRIEKYAIHGERIRKLLSLDILNDKLSQKNNELNQIIKRSLF